MIRVQISTHQSTSTDRHCSKPPTIIILDDDTTDHLGDQRNPINVETYEPHRRRGSNPNLPIVLDESNDVLVDPKGKRPIIVPFFFIDEVGESSFAPLTSPDVYCSICMESKFSFDCFSVKSCTHRYCTSCVSLYVAAKVEDNQVLIKCPDPDCKDGLLEPDMCKAILAPEVFDHWGRGLCEMVISSMKFYCPYKDCSALLVDEGGETITLSECPHCFRLFCAQCKVPWHTDFTCEEYEKMGPDRAKEDLMLMRVAKTNKWQRCPRCKYYVERIDGCLFMKCRCGTQFCYTCATETQRDHYCATCRR